MLKRLFTLMVLLGSLSQLIYGQCSPTDCPLNLPPIGTVQSKLELSGAGNPQLGVNRQYLRAVSLHIRHDAIDELDIVLYAPNGSSISLSKFQGIQIGQNITFNICFFTCKESPVPDHGFPIVFESDAGYQQNGFYDGSYFPAEGCLEDLSGSINGTWRLEVTDNFIQDGGRLLDWSLEFADNSGLNCIPSCLPEICDARTSMIGMGIESFCQGDPELNLDIEPQFSQSTQDTNRFGYAYILVDPASGLIIDVLKTPDLRNLEPGTYLLYGLSYDKNEWNQFPAPNGQYDFHDLIRAMSSGDQCIKPSTDHHWIRIQAPPGPADIRLPSNVCPGDTQTYVITDFNALLEYDFHVSGDGHDLISFSDSIFKVVWYTTPDTFQLKTTSKCGPFVQNVPVSLPKMPSISIDGPSIACPGDTSTYIISEVEDSLYQLHLDVTGGRLLTASNDTILILWNANGRDNKICSYLQGPICNSLTECQSIQVPDPQPDLLHLEKDSLCPGNTTWLWLDSNFTYDEFEWTSSGARILSNRDHDSIEIAVEEETDSVYVCVQFKNECGDSSRLCKEITVRRSPKIIGLADESSCSPGVFIQYQLENTDSIHWNQLEGPSDIFLPTTVADSTLIELDVPGEYVFCLNAFNEHCSFSDSVKVQLHESPQVPNVNTFCSLDSFSLNFNILKGTPPFSLNGDTIQGRYYLSTSYASGSNYHLQLKDANHCVTEISGTYSCPCVSYAEHEEMAPLAYCLRPGDMFAIPASKDILLDGNDTLLYIIHTDPDVVFGSEIRRSGNGELTYSSMFETGNTYYASLVVGSRKNEDIDLTDSCLYISEPRPFEIHTPSFISISDTLEACMNSTVEAAIRSEAEYPLEVTLQSDRGQNKKILLEKKEQKVGFDIKYSIENWFVQHVDHNCEASVQGKLQLRGFDPPSIELKASATICVNEHSDDTIDLSSLFLNDPSIRGKWTSNSSLELENEQLIVKGKADTGIYEFQFTAEQLSACEIPPKTVTLIIEACDCIQLQLPQRLALCNLKEKINLPDRLNLYTKGKWTIRNINSLPDPPVILGSDLLVDQSSSGEYEIRFTPESEHVYCAEVYYIILSIEDYLEAGLSPMVPSYCQEAGMKVDLFEMIENEDPNGHWYWLNEEIASVIPIDSFSADIHTFTYMHPKTEVCPSSQTQLNIEIVEKPEFRLVKENVKCHGDRNGKIEVSPTNDLNAPYSYLMDGQAYQSGRFNGLDAGNYQIQVSDQKGCYSDIRQVEITQPSPFLIDLGHDLEVNSGESFKIEFKTEGQDHEISHIEWFENSVQLQDNYYLLEHTAFEDSYIWVLAVNEQGCQATDSVWIQVKNEDVDISLPNVFNPRSSIPANRTFGMGNIPKVSWIESIHIFDRWGNQLFFRQDLEPGNPAGFWDGTVDGVYMQEGVYVYNFVYKTASGERRSLQGDISILY